MRSLFSVSARRGDGGRGHHLTLNIGLSKCGDDRHYGTIAAHRDISRHITACRDILRHIATFARARNAIFRERAVW